METIKQLRKLFLLICLIIAGVQSSWAYYNRKGTFDFQNFTFILYEDEANTQPHIAAIKAINGTEENVIVPSYVENGGKKYYVTCGSGEQSNSFRISNDYVKTLTFQEDFTFYTSLYISASYSVYMRCYLSCPQLTTIVFEGAVSNMNNDNAGTSPHLLCANLTDIYFKSTPPTLENSWSNYCTAPAGNITVHVAGWTAAQCQDKHDNALVWCDFAAVVPYSETPQMVNVNASVSDGGVFQISGQLALTNGSQTFEAEKNSDFTFYAYPSSANYQLAHVYVNGRDVIGEMETVNGQLKYTVEDLYGDTYISVVGESVYEEVWVSMSSGGYVKHSTSSGAQNIHNSTKVLFIKGTTKEFLVVPTDGYELDKYWKDGVDLTNVSGVLVPTGNQGKYTVTIDKGCNILFTFKAKNLITFQDAAVKQLCVDAGWDTNGDGEISKEEAAAVESLGEAFRNKTSHPVSISTFDELQYFTGLTAIDDYAFQQSGLSSVVLPTGVTSIGRSAFSTCNLTRIVLPDGLTSIGQNAFDSNSSLLSIELPQSLETIGSYAFSDTGLKNIYIPAGVTSIGNRQFEHCKDLISIVVDKNNTTYDSRNECNAIIETASNTLINGCRNTVIPDNVTAIAGSAFRTRGVPELVIPESVTSIGDYAFMWMNDYYGHPTYYLQRMELKWETPLQVNSAMFGTASDDYPKQCTLVVPKGKKTEYEAAGWTTTYFKEIVEDEASKVGVHAYATNDILVTMRRIMPNGEIENEGGGYGVTHQWIYKDQGVQICFFPAADDVLRSISYNWGGTIALDDNRLQKQADGSYILTLTAQDIGTQESINVFAVFEKAKAVDYVFVGKYQFVSAYADYNNDITYDGSQFYQSGVEDSYIGKVLENGSCIGQEMGIEFQLKNASDTFKAYRNGVAVQIPKDNNGICSFVSEDDSMHEAAQWVIIADDGSGTYDVNGDGEINITDVTVLVNKILHP